MIDGAKSKFATLEWDDEELAALREEMSTSHGKNYCILPAVELTHMLALMSTEATLLVMGEPVNKERLAGAIRFCGAAASGGLREAGFGAKEVCQIVREILDD